MKILSLALYLMASSLIIMLNKYLLTFQKFPSALLVATSQMLFTSVALSIASRLGFTTKLPSLTTGMNKTFPLPLLYCGSAFFGLSATGSLSLPMFSVLRRTSLFIALVGEYFLLGVVPGQWPTMCVTMSVVGALVAASEDLAFEATAYLYVMCANFASIGAALYAKIKQQGASADDDTTSRPAALVKDAPLTKWMLLYFNSTFSLPFMLAALVLPSVRDSYVDSWRMLANGSPLLVANFLGCTVMGIVLNYSILSAIREWGPLTVSVTGVMKSNVLTLLSMVFATDYVYSFVNAAGIFISAVASIFYMVIKFHKMKTQEAVREPELRKSVDGGNMLKRSKSFDFVVNAQVKDI